MFQALFMQERDGRRDLIAHQRKDDTQTKKVATPPPMPRSPKIARRACPQEEVKVKRHPTRANLIDGKVRFLSIGNNIMRTSLRHISSYHQTSIWYLSLITGIIHQYAP